MEPLHGSNQAFQSFLKQATLCHPLVSGAFNALPVMSPPLFLIITQIHSCHSYAFCHLSICNHFRYNFQSKFLTSPYGLLLWLIGRGVRERIPHYPLHDPAAFPPRLKGVTSQLGPWSTPSFSPGFAEVRQTPIGGTASPSSPGFTEIG